MLMDILDHWYVDFISRPNFYLNISMFSLITTTVLFGIMYTIISKLETTFKYETTLGVLRFLESTLFLLIFFFIFTTLATYLYVEGLI